MRGEARRVRWRDRMVKHRYALRWANSRGHGLGGGWARSRSNGVFFLGEWLEIAEALVRRVGVGSKFRE